MKKISTILAVVFTLILSANAQTTEFNKFIADDGKAGDNFGFSVATSGNYAIVGAHQNNTQGDESGSAYIYENDGGTWIQTAKLIPSDGAADDEFGYSVDIDGNYAVVGAYMDDDNGDESGSAYIFYNNAGTWDEIAKLTASDGETLDYFGYSVSISGDYVLIGAYGDDDNGLISGAGYIFHNSGTSWDETKLTITGNDQGDKLGTSVFIAGDYAVIGAMNDDDNGANSGAAYIFYYNSGWAQVDKITSADVAENDHFGSSVAVSDNYVVIGAYHEPHPDLNGAAYIFENNSGICTQVTKLTADDGVSGDLFGTSVSIYGDTVVVGAHARDDNGTTSGAAYVYTDTGTSWSQIFKLLASDGEVGDRLGYSVNISGNSVIIGAYGDDDNGDASGSAYVYYLTEDPFIVAGPYDVTINVDENASFYVIAANADSYQWQLNEGTGFNNISNAGVYSNATTSMLNITGATLDMNDNQYRCVVTNTHASINSSSATLTVGSSTNPSVVIETQKIMADDGLNYDEFGYTVAVSGDYAVVGAHQNNSHSEESGFAYIFYKNIDTWEQIKKLAPSDGAEDDEFGYSVSISGDYAVVGAYKKDDNGEESGAAYIFYKDEGGADNWGEVSKFIASDGEARDYFGYSVAISGDYAIVGAYGDDDTHNSSGAVYMYYNNSGTWEFNSKLKTLAPQLDDRFGWAVAVYGDYAIIGANNDAAYIFRNTGTWEQTDILIADDEDPQTHEYFGISVSIAEEYAVVGAYHDPWPECNGSAYVFYNNAGTWEQDAKLFANDAAAGDNFGRSVAVSRDTVIVGSPRNDFHGTASGSAYAFTKNGSNWEQTAKLVASDGDTGDRFGYSVAISENTVFAGAKVDDDNGVSSGSAYVFDNFENPFVTIEELASEYNFNIFPNPASNYICVDIDQENITACVIKIYDIVGRCAYQNNNYENLSQINTSNLHSGVYIVSIQAYNTRLNKVFIVK